MHLKYILCCLLLTACHTKQGKTAKDSWAGFLYTVQRGDTVHSIAKQKKISVFDLMEVNGIVDAGDLKTGQRLYIPEPDITVAVVKKSAPSQSQKIPKEPDGKKITLAWPVKNAVLFKSFDLSPSRIHEGIALAAPKGTPVKAAAGGEVIYVGDDGTRYGRIVILKHEDPFVTIYAHLDEVWVSKGQHLKNLEQLGTIGISGGIDSPRLYFQVRKNRTPVDPESYLK